MKKSGNRSDAELPSHKARNVKRKKALVFSPFHPRSNILRYIHDLELFQAKWRMQKEELLKAKEQAESNAFKYCELYDLAPSGYFTLSPEGKIIDLNLSGSLLLGKERLALRNSNFGFFLTKESRPIFNHFLENIFKSKSKESCEVKLATNSISTLYVFLTAIAIQDGNYCLMSAVDISESKLIESLQEKSMQLEGLNNLMIGREKKMIELKKEINTLLRKLGKEEKYIIHE
ncbi:MAG: PAS domain-containing protein [Bacteroidota bacterium]|nr:PAS domain-containing protein [Bacteroidota bacterium]